MKCSKCNADNREGVKFCEECGAKMEFNCPNCNALVPHGKKFCGECGNDLRQAKKTAFIDFDQPESYTPKHLSEKILTSRSAMEGERKLVTVLFADVADFTSLSEKLDPEEVHQIMDGCFKVLMDPVHTYEGTINQFTGDGVMALFGAPLAHEDHAQRACQAALNIQKMMATYTETVTKDYDVTFKMRIGLNSGPVIVGAIGDDLRMDYTAVGDTTNLAARMQSLAEPGRIVLSDQTMSLVKEYFGLRSLGDVTVKGKEKRQPVYELIKAGPVTTRIEASVSKGLTKFVGRKNSMRAFMDAYAKVKDGSGQVVGLVGEAGVGKSRLLLEFRRRTDAGQVVYLEGRCIHFGGAMPYLPIIDILKSHFNINETEREIVIKKKVAETILQLDATLKSAIPPIQDLLSLTLNDENYLKLEPKQRKERLFEALRDVLIRTSQNRILVIAIEDLHWIDKTSEEFIDYFIGWIVKTKVLLILLYRPEYTHQWGSKSYFNRIGVTQLTRQSSTELVKAILEGGYTSPELDNLILNRAAGNPFFMEELTHSLLENGTIQKEKNLYVLTRTFSDIQVPQTVQGVIAARIDRLEENLKKIIQVASVIGREFAFRILQAIVDMREELKAHLMNLQGLEFIYEKNLFPELEYIFKHAMTQEVAYNSLLINRRREIHNKIGIAIEQIHRDRLEEFYEILAYHYLMANNCEKAMRYSELTGDKALKAYANQEAFRFYKQAINLITKNPKSVKNAQEQITLHLSIIAPMTSAGYPEDSLKILRDGLDLSDDVGDDRSRVHFNSALSHYYLFTGDPLTGKSYADEAVEQAEKIGEVDLIAPASVALILSYYIPGEFEVIANRALKTIQLIEKTHKESEFFGWGFVVYPVMQSWFALSLSLLGKLNEAGAIFKKAMDFARHMNHFGTLGIVEWYYGTLFNARHECEKALQHFKSAISYLEKGEAFSYLPYAWTHMALAHLQLVELNTARECIQKAIQMYQGMSVLYNISLAYLFSGNIYQGLGELELARKETEKALHYSQQYNEKWIEGLSWIFLGRILGEKQFAAYKIAEQDILKGVKITEELNIKPWCALGHLSLGELYINMEMRDKAYEYFTKAETMYQDMGIEYWKSIATKALRNLKCYGTTGEHTKQQNIFAHKSTR